MRSFDVYDFVSQKMYGIKDDINFNHCRYTEIRMFIDDL